MTRITKPPLIRKKELVDTAERLFLEKGYDRTTVNDIVNEINVAKGTFYHYFKSKTEILGAVVEKNIAVLEEEFRSIISRDDMGSPEKLNEMINTSFRWYKGKEELLVFIHQESNAVPHYNFEEMTYARLAPPVVEV
ncbi:MAG: TetR/AcrR family transcriptional regulator, partial [Candidatus Hydrogenedentota bacterium]